MGRWADAHTAAVTQGSGPGRWAAVHGGASGSSAPTKAEIEAERRRLIVEKIANAGREGSFFEKIGSGISDAVAGVPRATLGILEEGGKVARLPTTVLANVIFRQSKADINKNPFLRNVTLPEIIPQGKEEANLKSGLEKSQEVFPVADAVAHGFGQTAAELDPRGGFANLRRNYGRDPVGSLLNDAANVSIVASGGATIAGKTAAATKAAEAGTVAARLSRIAEASGKVAALPFKPYELAAGLPARAGNLALKGATEKIAAGEKPTNLQGALVKLSGPAAAVEGEILRGRSLEEIARDTNAARGLKVANILTPDERVAALAVAERTAEPLALVRKHDPAGFDAYVEQRYEGTLTPAQAHLAADVVEGKAPELATKIDEALQIGSEGKGGRAERQAAFEAEHPDAAGYKPNELELAKLDTKAAKAIKKASLRAEALRARADKAAAVDVNAINKRVGAPETTLPISDPATSGNLRANTQIGRAEGKAHQLDLAARKAERDVVRLTDAAARDRARAEFAVKNAPSRLRPILSENRAASSHLTGVINDLRRQGLNESAAQVEAALDEIPTTLKGLEAAGIDAEHFFHTLPAREAKAGRIGRNAGLPRTFKAGSEKLRTGSATYERDLARGQAAGETEAAVAAIRHATAQRIEGIPGAVVHIGEGPLENVTSVAEAAQAGYVPWVPGALFDTLGKAAGDETMFMARPLFDAYRNYFEAPKGQKLGVVTDIPNRAYYLGRLAFSPGYITGQIFGNATLAIAGSSNPILFGKNLLRTVNEIRKNGGVIEAIKTGQGFPETVGPRLLRSGAPAAEMARLTADVEGKAGKIASISRGLNKAANVQFHMAAFLDNLSRSAFYLTELDKHGPEAALRSTLRTMGEFDKMSPFERDYVRRVIPMWAWHREITKIAFHLAVDHPLRIAWTLHLGDIAGKPDSPLPDFYMDTIPFGDTLIGSGQFFPHSEIGGLTEGGYLGVGKFLGPVPKIALGSSTGINPSTGKPFSRPYDPDNPTAPPSAPSIWKQAANLFPQTRLIEGLTGKDQIARYSTGDPVLVNNMTPEEEKAWKAAHPGQPLPKVPIPTGKTWLDAMASYFGVPVYDRSIAEGSARDAQLREAEQSLKDQQSKTKKKSLPAGSGRWAKSHGG